MPKIYLLIESHGDYEDYFSRAIRAYSFKPTIDEHLRRLNEQIILAQEVRHDKTRTKQERDWFILGCFRDVEDILKDASGFSCWETYEIPHKYSIQEIELV